MKFFPPKSLTVIKYVLFIVIILFLGVSVGGYFMNYKEGLNPGDASKNPGNASKTPGDTSKTPGDTSKNPGNASKNPGNASKTPGDISKTPGDISKTPVVDKVKTPVVDKQKTPTETKDEINPNRSTTGVNAQVITPNSFTIIGGSSGPGVNENGKLSNTPGPKYRGINSDDIKNILKALFSCDPDDKSGLCDSVDNVSKTIAESTTPALNKTLTTYTPPANNTSNVQKFANGINNAIGTAGSILSTSVDAAGNVVTKTLDSAGNVVSTTTDAAGNIISQTVGAAGNLLSGTANTLSNTAKDLGGDVSSTLTGAASGLSSLGQDAISGTTGLIENVGSNLANAITDNNGYYLNGQYISANGQYGYGQYGDGQMQGQIAPIQGGCQGPNMGVDFYSYYGALPSKTASNYLPVTADFSSFAK